MSGKQSAAMDRAERAVVVKGMTPAWAARQTGIAVQSIYRSAWYKAHRAAQKAATPQ